MRFNYKIISKKIIYYTDEQQPVYANESIDIYYLNYSKNIAFVQLFYITEESERIALIRFNFIISPINDNINISKIFVSEASKEIFIKYILQSEEYVLKRTSLKNLYPNIQKNLEIEFDGRNTINMENEDFTELNEFEAD